MPIDRRNDLLVSETFHTSSIIAFLYSLSNTAVKINYINSFTCQPSVLKVFVPYHRNTNFYKTSRKQVLHVSNNMHRIMAQYIVCFTTTDAYKHDMGLLFILSTLSLEHASCLAVTWKALSRIYDSCIISAYLMVVTNGSLRFLCNGIVKWLFPRTNSSSLSSYLIIFYQLKCKGTSIDRLTIVCFTRILYPKMRYLAQTCFICTVINQHKSESES